MGDAFLQVEVSKQYSHISEIMYQRREKLAFSQMR
jgi:hypothetical protein